MSNEWSKYIVQLTRLPFSLWAMDGKIDVDVLLASDRVEAHLAVVQAELCVVVVMSCNIIKHPAS